MPSVPPSSSPSTWRRVVAAWLDPVPAEKRALLAARWESLDARWRGPLQGFGRQSPGCGATIGVQPRCDFACLGCYLGAEANATPRAAAADVRRQLHALRRWLGPKGNVQLTDGELTLLPEAELLEIVRTARRLDLIPMLMTHGETLRRQPRLLANLVEAGLTEVAIHVDSLQRGRRDAFGAVRGEAALEPLRDELAEIVRATRRATGVRLRAATTMTVDRSNLGALPLVVRGAVARADVFSLLSLQPLAAVGRTRTDRRGVDVAQLWRAIGEGLGEFGFDIRRRGPFRFGHPDCTRFEPMFVLRRDGAPPRLLPLLRPDRPDELALARRYLEAGLGGLAFRDDPPAVRLARGFGALLQAPAFALGELLPWAVERLRDAGLSPAALAIEWVRRRARLDLFQLVSHQFMSADEVATPAGGERLAACAFRVPIGDRMVSMCEVNAAGLRESYYGELAAARIAARRAPRVAHLGSP